MKIIKSQNLFLAKILFTSLILGLISCEGMKIGIGIGSNFALQKSLVKFLNRENSVKKNDPNPTTSPSTTPQNGAANDLTIHNNNPLPNDVTSSNTQLDAHSVVSDDLPNIPIYHQGWIKFFRYLDIEGTEKPNKFFQNPGFAKQQKANATPHNPPSDQFGSFTIPDGKHFFGIIYKDTLNILTSRDNPIANVFDTLNIDFIKQIPDDDHYKGGVKDFGTFSEGSCFEVKTVRSQVFYKMTSDNIEPAKGVREVWLICTDNEKDKKQFMNIIIKLKIKKQHEVGAYIYTTKKSSPKDGKWVMLEDWGQCTLKCGGGLQYQQLMCVPPTSGGKPCEGPTVRTRPCNTQPCPRAMGQQTEMIKNELAGTPTPSSSTPGSTTETKPVIMKMMPISKRPTQYDKCYLKETDALMTKTDKQDGDLSGSPKLPVRIIMNNKTVAVYKDENLSTHEIIFNIRTTIFKRVKDNHACFILKGNNQKAQFCEITGNSGDFVEQWDYDFNLFKFQCKEKRATIDINLPEQAKLKEEYNQRMNEVKLDLVMEKSKMLKKQTEEKEEIKLSKKVDDAQAMTFKAIEREQRLEELMEKEELDRENQEQELLKKQYENEQKKKDTLIKSIKEKQLEDQFNISKANAENAVIKIKEAVRKDIMVKRLKMKQKLALMRKKNERKKQQIQNDIMTVRMEVAGNLQKVSKQGDMHSCFVGDTVEAQKIEEYCQVNFPDSIAKLQDCKIPESFCYTCCENEFGELNMVEREKCYKSRCDVSNTEHHEEEKEE
jgi:hypothetical protein